MSVHRFKFQGFKPSALDRYTLNGGAIDNAFPTTLDVTLTDDGDLPDLTDYLAAIGFVFVETSPAFPPNDWRQTSSYCQSALALTAATDVFFGFSGPLIGTIGTGLGIDGDMMPTRPGRITGMSFRSDQDVTLDVFVVVDASRTVIESGLVLTGGVVSTLAPTTSTICPAASVVNIGVQRTAGATPVDLNAAIEIEWG